MNEHETEGGVVPQTPLGRRAHVSEISATVAFLASDDASFTTGYRHGDRRRLPRALAPREVGHACGVMVTLQQLRYFLAAAERGTVSAAAEACFVSQPSLSEQLRRLEDGSASRCSCGRAGGWC